VQKLKIARAREQELSDEMIREHEEAKMTPAEKQERRRRIAVSPTNSDTSNVWYYSVKFLLHYHRVTLV
jgi:hypothetical protein